MNAMNEAEARRLLYDWPGVGQLEAWISKQPWQVTIPELQDRLALQNSIVTVDAMGCQTAIAERILARGPITC